MPNYIKSFPQLTSIMLHMLVLFAFIFYFDFSVKTVTLGKDQVQIVNSYVYQNNAPEKILSKTSQAHTEPVHTTPQTVATKGLHPALKNAAPISSSQENRLATKSSQQQNAISHGQQTSELIALLHSAIQKEQHYPASALQLEREGRVKVKFTLDTKGMVSNLQIAESSGTSSLDEAALSAVKDAAPFTAAIKYIQESKEYNIDISFELT